MFRSGIGRHVRHTSRFPKRCFHSSRHLDSEYVWPGVVEVCASKAFEFHNLFQYLHDSTGLPFLISIPLVTVFLRSLVSPLRYHLALCRREQREATPQLQSAARLIAKQGERRVAAGAETQEQTDLWMQKKWELTIEEVEKEYPRAKPTVFVNRDSSYDQANSCAALIVLANTSTILSQSVSNPTTLGLAMLGGGTIPLAICFNALAILNIQYYHGKIFREGTRMDKLSVDTLNPFSWKEEEARAAAMIIAPTVVAIYSVFSPPAIILALLSNSAYALLERKYIESLVPPSQGVSPDLSTATQTEKTEE